MNANGKVTSKFYAFLTTVTFSVAGFLILSSTFVQENKRDGLTDTAAAFESPAEQAKISSLKFNFSSYRPHFLLEAATNSSCGSTSTAQPFLTLIYIHSKPSNLEQREFIRSSWLSPYFRNLYNFRVVFILGNPHNDTLQQLLTTENAKFNDIVQEDFHDVYQNLTIKEAAALRWTARYCPSAHFIVKADDDVIVKTWFLDKVLQRHFSDNQKGRPTFFCQVFADSEPNRNPHSKWYTPKTVYQSQRYPRYCSGPVRIMSASAVPLLLEGIQSVPFLWLEDVFFSGLVAEKVGVKRVNELYLVEENSWNRWFFQPRFASSYSSWTALHAYSLNVQREVWKDLLQNHAGYLSG